MFLAKETPRLRTVHRGSQRPEKHNFNFIWLRSQMLLAKHFSRINHLNISIFDKAWQRSSKSKRMPLAKCL